MAGSLKVNSVQLGDSPTATNNFVLKTNVDGTAKLSRGNDGATTQDILTIDAAGNMSAGLQRIIHRGNLLGTVSQSGGVPTGAVIERGSNANGHYVRFADGTQICRTSGVVATAAGIQTITATFPAAFVPVSYDAFMRFEVGGGSDARAFAACTRYNTNVAGSVTFDVYSIAPIGTFVFAYGRWF